MRIPLSQVDAFASAPFTGNPAAVCFPPEGVSDAWLHSVAAEMNLSETAFLWPEPDGAWRLRWVTLTGSARCALGPYWAAELGETELRAYQWSPRGGALGVVVSGERVELRGAAITGPSGVLHLDA